MTNKELDAEIGRRYSWVLSDEQTVTGTIIAIEYPNAVCKCSDMKVRRLPLKNTEEENKQLKEKEDKKQEKLDQINEKEKKKQARADKKLLKAQLKQEKLEKRNKKIQDKLDKKRNKINLNMFVPFVVKNL